MRRSTAFLHVLALGAALLLAAAADARIGADEIAPALEGKAALVRRLGLTDLCLFTEARYTRHPSQADRFSPIQDHPHALERFPSGSLAARPR